MDKKTAAALEASIAKWEANVAMENPEDYLLNPKDCALCALFWEDDCDGCPVLAKSGASYCDNTPYYQVYMLWQKHTPGDPITLIREAAQAEVDFLKSLRTKS